MATFPIAIDDDGSPRAALAIADEAVRAFNHRTGIRFDPDSDGWWYAGDAYDALGNLDAVAGKLAQTIQHIAGSLREQLEDGHIGIDSGNTYPDAAAAAETVSVALEHARQALNRFGTAVAEAHNATAAMHYAGPDH